MKTKILKTKEFESKGVKHKHYTVAYKGRVFGVSTMRFDEGQIKIEGDVMTLPSELEVLKNVSVDPLTGDTKIFLDIVPKLDILLATI